MKRNKILFSPIHYVLTSRIGSEFSISSNIYNYFSKSLKKKAIFITGDSDTNLECVENLGIFDCKKIDLNIRNVIKFHILVFLSTLKHLKETRVLFHVLPFNIGTSVNLMFLLPLFSVVKIIGPIQTPLTYFDNDLDISDSRGFNQRPNSKPVFKMLYLVSRRILYLLNMITMKSADHLIVINSKTKSLLLSMGIPDKKIEVIHVGVDLSRFPKKDRNDPHNNEFDITLITVSYLLYRKRLDIILNALKITQNEGYKVKLIVVGDGPQKQNLIQLTKDLGLESNVFFIGNIQNEKISEFYHQADCFVSASMSEGGWCAVYLEALASGLPIISTVNEGSLAIIKEGDIGFVVPKDDFKEMANKIIYFIHNKNLLSKMTTKAREEVEKNYNWESILLQYEKLLKKYVD